MHVLRSLAVAALSATFAVQAQTNVAPLGIATQSSNFATEALAGAFKANDGNTDGIFKDDPSLNSVAHTLDDVNNGIGNGFAWWSVALGQDVAVGSIVVWNRIDFAPERLNNFTVTLLNDGVEVWSERFIGPDGPMPSAAFAVGGLVGDTVRVQQNRREFLQLAEVQVVTAVPEPATLAMLLAGLGFTVAAARRRR